MEKIMMSAREAGGKNLCLHVASELMKNQVMGSALSLSHAMASASDLALSLIHISEPTRPY